MATKKRRGRPRKLTAKQLEMARRYESVWHYEFAQLAEYRQKRILKDPLGTSAEIGRASCRELLKVMIV